MKHILIICISILPFISAAQDCSAFETGVYKLKMANGDFIPDYKIIRKKKVQIEKTSEGYIKSKVVWLDDCTYQLIHIKSDVLDIPAGNKSTVKILKTREDSYEAIGSSEATPGTKRFTMYKIK